jgi:hypothetical protein
VNPENDMGHEPERIELSEGEHAAAQTFWITTIGVLLFSAAAFFILL